MVYRLTISLFTLWSAVVLGGEAAAQAQPGQQQQEQVVRSFWRTACSTDAAGQWGCRMTRAVPKPGGGGNLMQMVITRDKAKAVQADFIVPIGAYLPSGVQFATEKDKWLKVAFTRCSPSACAATFKVDNALLKKLKTGNRLEVRFFMNETQPVGVSIDLNGFTAAFEKLEKQ